MRSFEEDASEDDQPATDASEDSVEVSVTPIAPINSAQLRRLPRKFRKAFEKDLPPTPQESQDPPVTSLPAREASPSPSPRAVSPHKGKGSRRKTSEPRRVIEPPLAGTPGTKRPLEEEWSPRKSLRVEGFPHQSSGTQPGTDGIIQTTNILGHNPFIGHFVPPHLLFPPAWPHVARYPYAHLVGSVLGPPLGLLPPYPPIPILPPRATPGATIPPDGDATTSSTEEDKTPLLNGVSPPPVPTHLPGPASPQRDPTYPRRNRPSKASKFLSVESLLSSSDPKPEPPGVREGPSLAPSLQGEPESPLPTPLSPQVEDDPGVEGPSSHQSIQSLLSQRKQKQRNYKNMTRERRIEANARERTRVHTISAAFETLRQSVPSFSHNQKLSKLSVLRIASAYILSLSRLAGHDYSRGETNPSFEDCVALTTKTIQVEGKAKKKRED